MKNGPLRQTSKPHERNLAIGETVDEALSMFAETWDSVMSASDEEIDHAVGRMDLARARSERRLTAQGGVHRHFEDLPDFRPGDTLRITVKVMDGDHIRLQKFEGVCIARSNKGMGSNFTVRRISFGEGVERVFPLYSPNIELIEVVRKGVVRRAKRYYLKGGKARTELRSDDPSGTRHKA